MKKLIALIWILLVFQSCIEKEPPIAKTTKGKTTIKGRAVIINSDVPVTDLNVFLWRRSDGVGMRRELVDETVTDSLGNYELSFDIDKFITLEVNYNFTPYLGYELSGNHKGEFNLDGKTHDVSIGIIPPAWVNVRLINKGKFTGWNEVGANSTRFTGISLYEFSTPDTSQLIKVQGNMSDTIHLWYLDNYEQYKYKVLKKISYPVTVPAFQTQDLLIEY